MNGKRNNKIALLTGLLASTSVTVPAAYGQTSTDSSFDELEEIVTTARKRNERLQDVPDTIKAFTAAQIEDRRLSQIDDFLRLTSNVNITNDQDTATNNISIRGLGSNRNQAAAVAFVVDGVVLPDADAFTLDLSDAESLEILKGPQGALYGKGAIAGAINITTKKPTNAWEGQVKAGYSSGDAFKLFGAVSGPVVEDKFLLRLTTSYKNSDGTIINDHDGTAQDGSEHAKISGRFLLTPSENLTFDFRGSYFTEDGGSLYFNIADVLGTTGGEITEEIAGKNPNLDGPSSTDREVTDVSLVIEYDTGGGIFTSISAYDKVDVDFKEDLDLSPYPMVPYTNQIRNTEGYSQELRYTSPDEKRLRYVVGGYYQHSTRDVITDLTLDVCIFTASCFVDGDFVSGGGEFPLNSANTTITFDQYAAFSQFNYDVSEDLELTVALRYDSVDVEQDDHLANQTNSNNFSEFQPKVSLAYKPSDDYTFYAIYSRGFKSGNFNNVAASANFPLDVKAETSSNYEVGMKAWLLDRTVSFNAAAFYAEQNNPQIFQLDLSTGGQGTLNAKRASVAGFEFDMLARVNQHFEMNVAFGYIDAKMKDFDGVTDNYVGQQLPNAPKYTFNIGGQYSVPVGDTLDLTARVDYFRKGRESFQDFQFTPDPDALLFQKSFGTVDAQITLDGENWALSFFAKNLFDRRHATAAFSRYIAAITLLQLGSDAVQPDVGRILGAELRFRF